MDRDRLPLRADTSVSDRLPDTPISGTICSVCKKNSGKFGFRLPLVAQIHLGVSHGSGHILRALSWRGFRGRARSPVWLQHLLTEPLVGTPLSLSLHLWKTGCHSRPVGCCAGQARRGMGRCLVSVQGGGPGSGWWVGGSLPPLPGGQEVHHKTSC